MNEQAKEPPKRSITIFKGQKLKCKRTRRIYVVVDALLSHKPISLPGHQIAGDVKGIIIQTVIHPGQINDFIEIQEQMQVRL